jgi:hypothetical protein
MALWRWDAVPFGELLTLSPDPPGYDIARPTPFHWGLLPLKRHFGAQRTRRGDTSPRTWSTGVVAQRIYSRAGSTSPFSFLSSTISSTPSPKHKLISLQTLARTNQAPWVSLFSAPHRHAPLRSILPALLTASHAHAITPDLPRPLSSPSLFDPR